MKIIGTFLAAVFGAFLGMGAFLLIFQTFGMMFTKVFMGEVSWEISGAVGEFGACLGFVLGLICGIYLLNESRRVDARLGIKRGS